MAKQIKPTEGELEILQVLWAKESATVREVHEELQKTKGTGSGYTTTLKLLQIMFEKGIVARDSSSKTHIYQPAVTKEKTQSFLVDKLIDAAFSGSSAQLVMQALGNHKASKEELDEISNFLKSINK